MKEPKIRFKGFRGGGDGKKRHSLKHFTISKTILFQEQSYLMVV